MKQADSITLGDFVRDAERRFEATGLAYGHGVSNAFDEAAFIALEGLQLPIDGLEEVWERPLVPDEHARLEKIIEARIKTRKPASYLLNRAYIQGLPFYVDERVIVPRSFIAEILCQEEGFSRIGDYEEIQNVAEICAGSGCLAILAAHIFPNVRIDAADISSDALNVAKRNVGDYRLESRISLFKGDLFTPLPGRRYDLIIANPPYVEQTVMDALPAEYRHEPAIALAGGPDGLDLVRRIIEKAADYLAPKGGILCEIGTGKEIIEAEYPRLPFLWLDTEHSEGEVFWLTKEQLDLK